MWESKGGEERERGRERGRGRFRLRGREEGGGKWGRWREREGGKA